jgi:hypothetical protein
MPDKCMHACATEGIEKNWILGRSSPDLARRALLIWQTDLLREKYRVLIDTVDIF